MSVAGATPMLDYFRRADVPREVRLLAAQGAVAPRPLEQLQLLSSFSQDPDPEIAAAAERTISAIPLGTISGFLARAEVPGELRVFFAARGIEPAAAPAPDSEAPLIEIGEGPVEAEEEGRPTPISMLPITDKVKLAMRGTREQRSQLIRDPNKLVSIAVLASPKLTDAEVEVFTRLGNVSEEVLRTIGANRSWMKNYGVMAGLAKNPKTPLGVSLNLMSHLNVRDIKMMSMDRNLPEQVRIGARKIMAKYRQK